MSIFLPFWWSPRVYFVHMDQVAGGWRGVFLRIRFEREDMWGRAFGFRIRVAFGMGAIETFWRSR